MSLLKRPAPPKYPPYWTVIHGTAAPYLVVKEGFKPVLFTKKMVAIYEAQYRNGWPADGDEATFAKQLEEERRKGK